MDESSPGPVEEFLQRETDTGHAAHKAVVPTGAGHTRWVRISHWIVTISFLLLAFSGVVILMAHPRLYWGEIGNDLTPALIELPISSNYRHGGWDNRVAFSQEAASPVTANRTYDIFNKNGWGRSLHFLMAWFLVVTGGVYLLGGVFTGHFRRNMVPQRAELKTRMFWREMLDHARLRIHTATNGPQYGLLQKCSYLGVVFGALPLSVVSGLAMSPAINAALPLSTMFGGFQSARTIHFFSFLILMLFLLVHVVMIIKSGFKRHMRSMTIGR